jgi:zinc protease
MKKIIFSIVALTLFTAVHAQKLDRSIRPKAGPAPEIKLGDAESFTLPNGLKVFVVENHKLPVVTYSVQLDVHPTPEGDKSGTNSLVGELITSGTKARTKDKFDEEVDAIGASLSATSQSIVGKVLTKHQDKLLDLMSDALLNANFQQSELDKLKKQTLSGLETSKNEPDEMLKNVSAVLNFGTGHPYGEVTRVETVKNITLADCNNYYKTYFRPNVAYMAIVGDINLAQAKELANKYFAKWEKAEVPKANYPAVKAPAATEVDFVPRDGAVQSVIGITYPVSLYPGTADVIKTRVVNEILGGSSQGRLFLNLREKHGWTYGSYSSIDVDDVMGNVQVYAKCRNEVTDSSVAEMVHEMNDIRSNQVSQDVLQNTLNYMAGTFAIGLENPNTIAQYAINIDRYKMPKDYYKNYLKNLSAVTAADVKATAEQYIDPAKSYIVVVGNKSEVEKLKRFSPTGTVKYFDNYGNSVKPAETKAVTAGVTAESVVKKYIDAIGGKAAVEGIKTLKIAMGTEMQGTVIKLSQTLASPDKYKMTVEAMGMVVQKVVMNGNTGYMESQGQKKDLGADEMAEFKQQADLQADLHPEKYGITYNLKGIEPVDGKDAYVIEEKAKAGKNSTKYYDVTSGLLVKSIAESNEGGEKSVQTTLYSDYQEVKNGKGYKVPFSLEQTPPGMKLSIQSAEANVPVADGDFK